MKQVVGRGLRAFGHFWWDFLVGDTPELAVAVAVIVGLAFALRSTRAAAVVLLPVLTAVFLVASVRRGRSEKPEAAADADRDGPP